MGRCILRVYFHRPHRRRALLLGRTVALLGRYSMSLRTLGHLRPNGQRRRHCLLCNRQTLDPTTMFSSFFSTSAPVDPNAPTFHPVAPPAGQTFGPLEPKDNEWACVNSGFVTETQVFYTIGDDGTFMILQIIHSAVGLWYPTIQFTCKIYNPKTKETTWKSINVNNFTTPPPNLDKRSCKADEFSVTYKSAPGSEYPESYNIRANLAADLQVSLEVSRPQNVSGWKAGPGEKGGYSYFGADLTKPEGYVVHRFWPRYYATGHIIRSGAAESIQGAGMFVHAIQGMRPNLVASGWNFAHFQSAELGGVSALQMEFTTIEGYGKSGASSGGVVVNVGSVVVGDKLTAVTAETRYPEVLADGATRVVGDDNAPVLSRAIQLTPEHDPATGYNVPTALEYEWKGLSILPDAPGTVTAKVHLDVGGNASPQGLIEKVDVLAEIPKVIKLAVNYVAGTKPYVYQWLNPAKLLLSPPGSEATEVEGTLYNEATFIS
ncbi:hypothetical protein MKEN_00365300 [Mycena kentingensis (nom. inval.)]|nr:hypothetical protein MKEN_00365300 [Mycena kentingensis (nom. inval.)]